MNELMPEEMRGAIGRLGCVDEKNQKFHLVENSTFYLLGELTDSAI